MRLAHQLLISMAFIAIVAIALTSVTSIFVASSSLENSAREKLSAIVDGRRNQLETYFEGFDDKLRSLSRTDLTFSALEMFEKGFGGIKSESATTALQDLIKVERSEDELYEYYDQTGTIVYDAQLEKFGPLLNQFASENALGDLYLISKSGLVLYSANANDEIGTNLIDGPYAQTSLGAINNKILNAAKTIENAALEASEDVENGFDAISKVNLVLEPFAPYELSEKEPVSFIGMPVFDINNTFQGALIAQLSRPSLSKILTNRTGLGETGETFMTDQNGLLLFDSQFTSEFDPLNTKINLGSLPQVSNKEVVTGTVDQYRGMTVFASVAEVHYIDTVWKVVAVIDKDEALSGTTTMEISVATVAAIILAGALAFAFWFARGLTKPINAVIGNMKELSSGHTDFRLDGIERKDEVGDIVRSLESFREAAIEKMQMEEEARVNRTQSEKERIESDAEKARNAREVNLTVEQLAEGLETLAAGDLIQTLDEPFMDSMEPVRQNFNSSIGKLRKALESIDSGTSIIRRVSAEISDASNNLSSRTESQAASLEEAAAAIQELTENVRGGADQATEAAKLAQAAKEDTDQSTHVVSDAVNAMSRIEQASNDISGIINVIDEIAFQTNLLALNAGVEAARAGDAGKGFAVVAQEVRELASRSATAAKEIKDLIDTSNDEVGQGVKLVKVTGEVLEKISSNVANINDRISEVANSATEQLDSIETVNASVNEVDQRVQQNAAMAEETTAATVHLVNEIDHLSKMVGAFQIVSPESADGNALKKIAKRMM